MATIFYSWQADLDTKTCRNLIERALAKAIERLQDATLVDADRPEDDLERHPEADELRPTTLPIAKLTLDKDTQGVPGSPPIAQTIFEKIEQAAIFVPDLTSIARRPDGRLCSNPNVLIEYGWALKCLGHKRIIPVMNTAYGAPSAASLPFDMIHLRHPITFDCPSDASEEQRKRARETLAKQLQAALLTAIGGLPRQIPQTPRGYVTPYPDPVPRFRATNPIEPVGVLHGSMYPLNAGRDPSLFLRPGALMWLRLMPRDASNNSIGSRLIEDAFRRDGLLALPLNRRNDAHDIFYIRAEDGFGACVDAQSKSTATDKTTASLVFAMTSGEVWSMDTSYMDEEGRMVLVWPEAFVDALTGCAALLSQLGIAAPYRWVAGVDGARSRRYVEFKGGNSSGYFLKDSVVETGEYDGDPAKAQTCLDPFFKALRQAAHMR